MHHRSLLLQDSRISYYRWGSGPRFLLCFHGYGESASGFSFLEEVMGAPFTILAIDLPFHGETDWNEGPLTTTTLITIIDQIIAQETGTAPAGVDALPDGHSAQTRYPSNNWWLMGYSMGGRVALSLLEQAPGRTERLFLLAPDGLVVNPWYWMATQTSPGRSLFKWTMYHPEWFFFILRTANKLKMVNPSVYKFVANYVDNRKMRVELYTRWTGLRLFKPRLAAIKDIIRIRHIPVQLLYGKFDRIIRAERGEQFRKGIEPWCELLVIPAGHQLLKKEHIQPLLTPFLSK
jgi:pimeloyl-ACP methyl ester carboxylesterase